MDRLNLDIYADRNGNLQQEVSWINVDLTGVTMEMQVRIGRDAPGPPLISLANVSSYTQGIETIYAGTDTVANHIAAGRLPVTIYKTTNPATGVNYVAGDSVLMSTIWIIIVAATMQALPYSEERGDDVILPYDVYFSAASIRPSPYLFGNLVVRAGVTIP